MPRKKQQPSANGNLIIIVKCVKNALEEDKAMKKIINGKRYDTEKAKLIGWDLFSNRRDFNFWQETLYQKRTGEFFLHGEGGAASKYAESAGQNEWTGGSKLIPLSFEKAKKWAEEHLDADTYEAVFGEIEESTDRLTVTFSLPTDAVEILKRMAAQTGKAQSDIIADWLRNNK